MMGSRRCLLSLVILALIHTGPTVCLAQNPWRLRKPGPLSLVTAVGLPSPPGDAQEVTSLVEKLRAPHLAPPIRAQAARNLAGLEEKSVVQALVDGLFQSGRENRIVRVACAQALTWPAANDNQAAVRALYRAFRGPGAHLATGRAVARALLDSRGAEEVFKAFADRLCGRDSAIPVRAETDENLLWLWMMWFWLRERLGMCHFKPGTRFTQAMDSQVKLCLLRLPALSDEKLASALEDGDRMLGEWIVTSTVGPALLRKLVAGMPYRSGKAKSATLRVLSRFMYGDELAAMLDVGSLKRLRDVVGDLSNDEGEFVRNLITTACHGREVEILDKVSVSLVDAAKDALSGRAVREGGREPTLPGLDTQELSLAQLTVAAAESDKALDILLSQLSDEVRNIRWRTSVARRLLTAAAYRGRDKARIHKQVLAVLDGIVSQGRLDRANAGRFAWARVMAVRFMCSTPDGRERVLRVAENRLDGHPFELASFLYDIQYSSTEAKPKLALQIAEVIVRAYEKVFRTESRRREHVLNLLRSCRAHLSPERLRREVPVDWVQELIPPGHGKYVSPEEWKSWLERFRELPVFRKN